MSHSQSLLACHYLDPPLTDALSPTELLPLQALDECGGLIAFFRERISMSCRECFSLMHKEQAARAQNGGRGFADTFHISQLVKF